MPAGPKPHNLPLEGLRGLAALMVLYCHYLSPTPDVDPRLGASPWFWTIESGQAAVALFFVISGFVIGFTNPRDWSGAAARDYLWRRFVRLVPLYVIAILLSEAIRPIDAPRTILGNLFFLQHDIPTGHSRIPTLLANTNLWSLNYEVLYYLLFLAVWKLRVPIAPLAAAAAVFAAIGYFQSAVAPLATTYAAGWVFWLAGLWLAWRVPPRAEPLPPAPWPALLVLFVLQWKIKPLWMLLHRMGWDRNGDPGPLSLLNLDFIPICVLLVAVVTQRRGRAFAAASWACLLVSALYWVWRGVNHSFSWHSSDPVYAGLAALAAAFWWWRPSLSFFTRISLCGFLCYGLYIFQRPAQWLVCYRLPLPSGTVASLILRLLLLVPLTFLLAWLGERRLQPVLRRGLERLRPRRPRMA